MDARTCPSIRGTALTNIHLIAAARPNFMNVVTGAKLVITDSGGLQEETTYLDIPCLTMRENTERPITISQGTSRLVCADNLADNVGKIMAGDWPTGTCPQLWDEKTAARAIECLRRRIRAQ